MEKLVIENKKGKMTHDRIDYENDKVYTWKRPMFSSNRSRKNRGKQVSFSDQESDAANDTLVNSASDSSLERSTTSMGLQLSNNSHNSGHPHDSSRTPKKKKSIIKKQEEEVGGIKTPKNTHYSLRGKTKQ